MESLLNSFQSVQSVRILLYHLTEIWKEQTKEILQSFYEDRHLETETCDYIDNDETHE